MKEIKVGIVGLGSVGQGVLQILNENLNSIESKINKKIKITGISAKNKNKKRDIKIDNYPWFDNPIELSLNPEVDVLIELVGGEDGIALKVVETALKEKKHVITANKALIAKHGNHLINLAEKNNVKILFEAAVAGAIPIIKTLKESTASNSISAIYGILNGTCNYILTSMERDGVNFNTALKSAQDLGFAESDPTFDIEGYDTAHKLAILSSIAYSKEINFMDIDVQGITKIELDDILAAKDYGYKIKLLGVSKKQNNGEVIQVVRPTLLPMDSNLAMVDMEKNAIFIRGNFFSEIMLVGPGAGRLPTASSVMSDLFDLANVTNYPALGITSNKLEENIKSESINSNRYYLRLFLPDISGTMASITNTMASYNISIDDITQRISKKMKDNNLVPITIISSSTDVKSINKAVEEINKNNYSPLTPNIIIIED
jgi:homoserine dehydrogenase